MDYDEVQKKVSPSGAELVELKDTIRKLQARVDRHALVIGVLKDMLLLPDDSEEEFLKRLERAAAQKTDDKNCRKCGKAMNPKHTRCIYCGEPRTAELL